METHQYTKMSLIDISDDYETNIDFNQNNEIINDIDFDSFEISDEMRIRLLLARTLVILTQAQLD